MKERRRFVRLFASVELSYKEPGNAEWTKTPTRDISGGGVRFFCEKKIDKGSPLELGLLLPGHDTPIRARGEVSWIREPHGEEKKRYRIGVKFTDIEPHDISKIFEYVYATGMN